MCRPPSNPSSSAERRNPIRLTPQQLAFIDTFGYLIFPGLLRDRIDRITAEFESVFATQGGGHGGKPHDGTARSCIVPFIDQNEYLSALIDDERVEGIFASLLGEDFNYIGSDGNFYVGDTNWHSDTDWSGRMRGKPPRIFYKMALYLDPITRDTGALRVIPGSQHYGDRSPKSYNSTCAPPRTTGASAAPRCRPWPWTARLETRWSSTRGR